MKIPTQCNVAMQVTQPGGQGMIAWTKLDEFSENFQTASIFGKKCCAFVREIGARSAFPLPKKRNIIFRIGNDPPPSLEVFRKFIESVRESLP